MTSKQVDPTYGFIQIKDSFYRTDKIVAVINFTDCCRIYGPFSEKNDFVEFSTKLKITQQMTDLFRDNFLKVTNTSYIRYDAIMSINHDHNQTCSITFITSPGNNHTVTNISKSNIKEAVLKKFNIKI